MKIRRPHVSILALGLFLAGAASSPGTETEKVPELDLKGAQESVNRDTPAAEAHFQLGQDFFKQEILDKAEAEYRQALKADPVFAPAHFGLGFCLEMKGDVRGAIKEYLAAKRYGRENFDACWRLGEVYNSLGLVDKAIQEYLLALEIEPANIPAHLKIGMVYLQQGLYPEAGRAFRRVLEIDPDNRVALFNLAKCLKNFKSVREIETELLDLRERMKNPEAKGLVEKILGEIGAGR